MLFTFFHFCFWICLWELQSLDEIIILRGSEDTFAANIKLFKKF